MTISRGWRRYFLIVMAGHSRSKNGVASARLCPAIHVFVCPVKKDVDARAFAAPKRLRPRRRDKPAHDE
jgi:hypothetical protein